MNVPIIFIDGYWFNPVKENSPESRLMLSAKAFLALIRQTFNEWRDDQAPRLAAALSYYTIFSLAPLLLIAVGVSSILWDRQLIIAHVLGQAEGLLGSEGRTLIEALISPSADESSSWIASVIGIVTLVLGALAVFGELRNALDTIWEVEPEKPKSLLVSLRSVLVHRAVAFGLVLGIGFLLLVSLLISTILAALEEFAGQVLPISAALLEIGNFVVSLGLTTFLFALLFKYLPNAKIAWRDVWLGAGFTAVLFSIGKFLIGQYLGSSAVGSDFGAAGALALILVWVNYSAQLLFFGAEFTQVFANRYGSRILSD